MFRSRWRFALLTTITALPATGQDPVVSSTELRALDGLAKRFATVGRESDTWTVVEVLRDLGYPDRSLTTLEQACTKTILKDKPARTKPDQLLRQFDQAMADLRAAFDAATGDPKQAIARAMLKLDGRITDAHEVLGHSRVHGRWTEPWMQPLLDREVEIHRARSQALALELEPGRITESSEVLLEHALGRAGVLASAWNLTIHTSMSRDLARQIVVDYGRASAFANFLLTGKLEPLRPRAFQFMFVDSKERYDKLLDVLQQEGRMPAEEASSLKQATFFWDPRNEYYVMLAYDPRALSAYLLAETLNLLQYREQQFLRAGLANYVCLTMLGCPLPDYVPQGAVAVDAASSAKQRLDANLISLHSRLGELLRRGKDPAWSKALDGNAIGDIRGDLLAKCTSITQLLCAERPLDPVFAKCHESEAADAKSRREQLEKELGMSIEALEQRWQTWMRADSSSIGEQLEELTRVSVDKVQSEFLKQLNAERKRAIESVTGTDSILSHDLLSSGAARHLRYLAAMASAPADWATAHVQQLGASEFSIEGLRAGPNCVIAAGASDAQDALDRWLGSFYDRLALLDPGLTHIGFAWQDQTFVVDCRSLVTRPAGQFLVRWPHADMKRVPTNYSGELRNPVPAATSREWGYPITLQVYRGGETATGSISMTLFLGNPTKGQTVDCFVSTPDSPSNPSIVPSNAYGLIPKAPLKKGASYTVVAIFDDTAQRVIWSFKT